MTRDAEQDPNLEAAVERALAPYRDLLPPEDLAEMRRVMREHLATNEVSARLLKQLGPVPNVGVSGDMERQDGAAQPAPARRDKAESGGKR